MKKLFVIKIGGNVIDNPTLLDKFLSDFTSVPGYKILIHGGGKIATQIGNRLGIESKYVDGRRITDDETIDVVTMVYAGLINKKIVAQLQARECNAMGLTGADLNAILAHKRTKGTIDYGFAGDIDAVNTEGVAALLDIAQTLVFAPITHDKNGQLLNTNADTIASTLAVSLSSKFKTTLKYVFEKKGVLSDVNDDDSVIANINFDDFQIGKSDGTFFEGMIPKLDNAFDAMKNGVQSVVICGVEGINDDIGTQLSLD